MANPQLVLQQVVVELDLARGVVIIDPPQCDLSDLDGGVTWRFLGLPNTWLPVVEFDRNSPYGPFLTLQQASSLVVGRGTRGQVAGEFPYRARFFALDGAGALVRIAGLEAKGSLFVVSPMVLRTAPDVSVTIILEAPLPVIEVHPQRVQIFDLDVVTWSFSGLLPHWYPMVYFTGAPQQLPRPALGPFATLSLAELAPEAGGEPQMKITAAGNVGPPGRYLYDIALVERATHLVVHRLCDQRREGPLRVLEDPVVDNNGPVIGTGGGT